MSIDTEPSPVALYHTNDTIPEYATAGQIFTAPAEDIFEMVHTHFGIETWVEFPIVVLLPLDDG